MQLQLLRFGQIGLLATGLHVMIALAAAEFLRFTDQMANLTGFAAAVTFSFVGHTRLTFAHERVEMTYFPRFLVTAVIGLLGSAFVTYLVGTVFGQHFWVAMVAVAATVPVLTFVLLKGWVYTQTSAARGQEAAGIVLCLLIAGAVVAVFWGRLLNHDTVWYLIATERWLAGAELYADIVEVNPPINFYYTVPAVLIAQVLQISPLNGQYIAFAMLLSVSLAWCWRILSVAQVFSFSRQIVFILCVGVAVVVPAMSDLVQRDHIFVVFLLPWLFGQLQATGPHPQHARALRACFAALGVMLKPYFVLIPLAITLWQVVTRRSWKPILAIENMIFVAIGLAYIGFVWVMHPLYFTQIMPIARDVYGSYGTDPVALVSRFQLTVTGPLLIAMMLVMRSTAASYDFGVFATASIGAALIYFAQQKGFDYHTLPFMILACLAIIWAIFHASQLTISGVAGVAALTICFGSNVMDGPYQNKTAKVFGDFAAARGPLVILTSHVWFGPISAFTADVEWASRKPAQWYVPGVVNGLAATDCMREAERCRRLSEIGDIARSTIVEDLTSYAPTVIVLDKKPGYFNQTSFDWHGFMAADTRFEQVLQRYDLHASSERFEYYTRRP